MCCRCCSVTQQKVWVFTLGTISIIFGLLSIIWWPDFIEDAVAGELPLSACSRTYEPWAETPIPVYNYMYLFNWTNPEQVRNADVKPNFEQVGPYVFREEKVKEDVTWHYNKTVTFKTNRTWYFEPEMSEGTLEDLVTCPHLPSIAASNVVRDEPLYVKLPFNIALNSNGGALYQTHTAIEWLFDGFYDEFLDYAMKLNNSMTGPIDSNYFAWFLNRNGSSDFEGAFTIHTGQGDLREMGELKFWNGMNHTGYYEGECGVINGSTSDLFVPNRGPDEYITVYITDTCRIINLVPTGEEIELEGIKGLKYETKPDTFDNGQLNADMKCYCPTSLQPDYCLKTGATDLGPCAEGAPMIMSHAHFMWADPYYADMITGMNPDYERDNFFIIMERKMGIPLQVQAAVQVSLYIQRDDDITILREIPNFYAPLFVTASRAVISAELARDVRLVLMLPSLGRNMGIGILVIGVVMIVVGIALSITHNWYGEKRQMKAKNEDFAEAAPTQDVGLHEERTAL